MATAEATTREFDDTTKELGNKLVGLTLLQAKALADYARISKTTLSIKGGLVDNRVLSAQDVSRLATMPPVEVLRARLLGTLQSPLFTLQNVLSASIYNLYSVLNARIQQLGGTADA